MPKDFISDILEVTGSAVEKAKKKIDKSVELIALDAKINRLNRKIEAEYEAIGKLVYKAHTAPDSDSSSIDDMLAGIDAMVLELDEIKAERERRRKDDV